MATDIALNHTDLRELNASFEGHLVMPGDSTYDEHRRVWNRSIDRFTILIARCSSVADVIAAVRFAHATSVPVAA